METLRTYLTTLSPTEQAHYARKANTTIGYLRKALCKGQRFDGALARRLDEASGGRVSRYDLRPDVFGAPPHRPPAGGVRCSVRKALFLLRCGVLLYVPFYPFVENDHPSPPCHFSVNDRHGHK
ncbi:hypothetical protein P303_08960 [Xylella fastidiosa MUL0034]|nr:hypothetical protein P303_08960 [Xylella fastidiosa MUL0034]